MAIYVTAADWLLDHMHTEITVNIEHPLLRSFKTYYLDNVDIGEDVLVLWLGDYCSRLDLSGARITVMCDMVTVEKNELKIELAEIIE